MKDQVDHFIGVVESSQMNTETFIDHVASHSAPEKDWNPALQALWYAEKGDWKQAHTLCQQGDREDGAWVHAHLHREEGDFSNARYWYQRAEKPESELSIEAERHAIVAALMNG